MNDLTKYLVEGILAEMQGGIKVMLPGGFKPPHEGHLMLAKGYASMPNVSEVVILITPKERDGITVQDAKQIWNQLLVGVPNVRVQETKIPSPLTAAYEYVKTDAKTGETVALGASSKGDDYARVRDFVAQHQEGGKYFRNGVSVVELPFESSRPLLYKGRTDGKDGQPISASQLRADLAANDFENFKTNYPSIQSNSQIQTIFGILKKNQPLNEVAVSDFIKKLNVKFKDFMKAVREEGTETMTAFNLIIEAAQGKRQLTKEEQERVGNQMKEALKTAGLIAASVIPGGTIYFILVRLLRLDDYVYPKRFLSKNAVSVGQIALAEYQPPLKGAGPNYDKSVNQIKSVMQTFFEKLKSAPRDLQRDFAQLYAHITKTGRFLTRIEVEQIAQKLEPVLIKSGYRAILNKREYPIALLQALKTFPKLQSKVPQQVLAEQQAMNENIKQGLKKLLQKGGNLATSVFSAAKREGQETVKAVEIINKAIKGQTITDNEKVFLKAQSKDLIKILPLVAIQAIPVPIPITPFLIVLGKKIGYDVLPNSHKTMPLSALTERKLLKEGGAAGHMAHPYEDVDLTFEDIENLIDSALTGQVEYAQEKLDGQNLMVTYKDGRVLSARNKGQLKNAAEKAMSKADMEASMAHLPDNVKNSFLDAMGDMEAAISKLSPTEKQQYFGNGKKFVNMEVLHPASQNVAAYGVTELRMHNIQEYDDDGNVVGSDATAPAKLQAALDRVEAASQSTYDIKSTDMVNLKKTADYEKQKTQLLTDLEAIRKKFNLSKTSKLGMYFQNAWSDFVKDAARRYKYDIPADVLQNIVNRWAFGSKTPDLRQLRTAINNPEFQQWFIETDKGPAVRDQKKAIVEPVEDIFLKLGVFVLQSLEGLVAINPNDSIAKMKGELASSIEAIKQKANNSEMGDDDASMKFLKHQLRRLEKIGGFNAILPTEGIVFKYNGKLYKLTGAFAPLNQIIGYIKFGR